MRHFDLSQSIKSHYGNHVGIVNFEIKKTIPNLSDK